MTTTNTFDDIPEPHRISLGELDQIHNSSFIPEHFALNIVMRWFPYLFCPDKLKMQYSFNVVGTFFFIKLCKRELDQEIKVSLQQRYVLYYHPDVYTCRN